MDSTITAANTAIAARPPLTTYEGLAKMIDHSLLRPELNEEQVLEGIRLARRYDVASVCGRPGEADLIVRELEGSTVAPSSVVGFPHGGSTTAAKIYEARDLLRRGIKEIDMVLNIGKLISRQFQYVEMELMQIAKACHEEGAILKVIFENAYLTEDLKVIACKISKRAEVDYVKTSTGFAPSGYTREDLLLMKRIVGDRCKVKAAGGVRTVETALEVYECGCDRFGATQTAPILDAWKARLDGQATPAANTENSTAY
jgi:deoxyribose-phosphate aldolase